MSKYPYVENVQRFARDTADHTMTVLHDDGLHRHLQFRNPNRTWSHWFDLITVPGALIFQGDGETYAFRRLEDMFAFFRQTASDTINPGYWGEKLTGRGGRDGVMHYQQELLEGQINEVVAEAMAEDPELLAGLPAAIKDEILDELVGDESLDRDRVVSFRFWANDADEFARPSKRPDFEFHDVWEWDTRDFDWWFLWACQAITWGIAQYDAYRNVSRWEKAKRVLFREEPVGLSCTPLAAPPLPTPVVDVHLPEPAEAVS